MYLYKKYVKFAFSFFFSLLQIAQMRDETYQIEKELENRHSIVNNVENIPIFTGNSSPIMEGYLFKRTSNAFKTWNRRWFYLYDNKLVYR